MKRALEIVWDNAKVLLILFILILIIYLIGDRSNLSIIELIYYFIISVAVLFIVYLPFFLFGKGFKKIKGKIGESRYNKNKQQMWIKAQQSPADMFAYKARYGEFEEE